MSGSLLRVVFDNPPPVLLLSPLPGLHLTGLRVTDWVTIEVGKMRRGRDRDALKLLTLVELRAADHTPHTINYGFELVKCFPDISAYTPTPQFCPQAYCIMDS